MDVSPFVALLPVALLSLLLFATWRKGSPPSRPRDGRRPPPSPPGLPLLGHLPLLGSLPHRRLQAMAASHGPVMLLPMGRVPTVVVSSAAAAEEVMKTRDQAFASRPRMRLAERLVYGNNNVAFVPTGEQWRQARRVSVLHLLGPRRVRSFRRAREQEAAAMVGRVRRACGGGGAAALVVNLNAVLISYSSGIISRAALGIGGDLRSYGLDGAGGGGEGERLTKLFDDVEELLETVTMAEMLPWLAWVDTLTGLHAKAARTSAEMDAFLERVIAEHRQRRSASSHRDGGGDDDDHRDFVDVLLDANEAEAEHDDDAARGAMFDNDSIKGIILNMFVAATEPTYTTLLWAMAELINHPDEMRKVQDEVRAAVVAASGGGGGGDDVTECHLEELRYHRCVIKETLRLHATVPLLLPRETTEDTELLGYRVPARTRVIVNAWAIARDPAAWERADEFLPERFAGDDDMKAADYLVVPADFRFVPFGAGRRGCPGVGFAAPAMELALASLLYHFDWALPAGGPCKVEMDELKGLSVRLKTTLHLIANPWSPQ